MAVCARPQEREDGEGERLHLEAPQEREDGEGERLHLEAEGGGGDPHMTVVSQERCVCSGDVRVVTLSDYIRSSNGGLARLWRWTGQTLDW